MDPLLLVVGGAALLAYLTRKPAAQQQPPPPPPTTPQGSGGGLDAQQLGEVGLGALGGAIFANAYANEFVDSRSVTTRNNATAAGAVIGGGQVLLVGGTTGALTLAGGSVLLAGAILVVPAVVVIAAVLSIAGGIEGNIRQARFRELYEEVQRAIAAKDWQRAWDVAAKGAAEGYPGLGWSGGGVPETFKAPVAFTLPDGRSYQQGSAAPVKETMRFAYSLGVEKGREWAQAIQAQWPWLNYYRKDGTLIEFQPIGPPLPDGSRRMLDVRGIHLRSMYEPGFSDTARFSDPTPKSPAEYQRLKQEATATKIALKVGGDVYK